MNLTLQEIARTLGGAVSGQQILAPGPGHTASDRSLSICLSRDARDGFIVHSFAGDDPLACRDYVRGKLQLTRFKPVRTSCYDYCDAHGAIVYRKKRIEREDGSKTFAIEPKGRGGSQPLLYGVERLADLVDEPVWIVEGEKKVDRLRALGAVAVCGDTGASSKWLPMHAEALRGLRVILWPDSDEPGEKYIANAATAILAADPHADIRVVRPFGLPKGAKGQDVCDWDGDASDLVELAASAKIYAPVRPSRVRLRSKPVMRLSDEAMKIFEHGG
jgi:hypothetical protein